MIRFSAVLVVIAVAVLIGGVATSTLLLVYVAIVLSAAALIALAIGVARKRDELFGGPGQRPMGPVGDVMGSGARRHLGGQSGGYPAGQGYPGQPGYPGYSGQQQGYAGQPAPGAGGAYGGASAPGGGYGASGAASGPPAPRVTSAPGRSAPLPSSRSVTETRADLQALGTDTPQTGNSPRTAGTSQAPGSPRPADPPAPVGRPGPGQPDADETRTDLPPVRPGGPPPPGGSLPSRSPGSRPAGADETRLDLSPVLDDQDLKDKVVSTRPAAGGTSRSPETRYDMPALGETTGSGSSGTSGSPGTSRSPETRYDMPAQPDTPAQYGTSAPEPKPMTGGSQVAVIPGVPRYHAPGCILIRFMDEEDLELKTLDEAKAAGCTPCTACQAD